MIINNNDCIAAISTPSGSGGIAIIRLSGENAFLICDKVFCTNKQGVLSSCASKMADHNIKHGYIFDKNEFIDEVLVSRMDAPHTYTGENTIEINCHGGFAVASKTLSLLIKHGARPAEPGEFTKRAFLNGRIDLAKAESVMDIINAKTESGRKAAVAGLSGRLGEQITEICAKLTEAAADFDVSVDWPEYEFDEEMGGAALRIINEQLISLKKLQSSYERGRLAKEGIKMVIAGAPNAGKSSLMNIFSGTERSIVTDIPGTTRDLIDEFVQLDGFPIWITDTAGIRETDDLVEKIGVDRALEKLRDADIVLYVIDSAVYNDDMFFPDSDVDNLLVLANKSDLPNAGDNIEKIKKRFGEHYPVMEISAKTNDGIEALFDKIKDMCKLGDLDFASENIITNERHRALIGNAIELLTKSLESHDCGMPLDMSACDLRLANEKLCEILGKNVSDEIVDNIFSRFCVGK